jgi:hypothetical protein
MGCEELPRIFERYREGVIILAKIKKKAVLYHKLLKGFGVTTECGIASDNTKSTWAGVKCKRCLKVKEAEVKAKAAKKAAKKGGKK